MPPRHVVVDGSNIATEGRSIPSLAHLDEAVREFIADHPETILTVVVDATFGHRIDPSEREAFDDGVANGELVSPPAGAIGRGDAFLLRVAQKVNATVLSNDSFQEFHGEHAWLFDEGRLIGAKPVPGVGWIFTLRSPVRGPASRIAVQKARRAPKDETAEQKAKAKVTRAIKAATGEVEEPSPRARRRRRGGEPPSEPVNEPLPFITFVSDHRLGTEVDGEVAEFTSHGAFVTVDGVRCYVPLSAMGDPPPRSAREVMQKGEQRRFVVQALDPPRRGIELALPEFAHPAGAPTEETVAAEIEESLPPKKAVKKKAAAKKKAAPAKKAAVKKKAPVKKKAAAKKKAAPAKKAAKKKAGQAKKTGAKKAPPT